MPTTHILKPAIAPYSNHDGGPGVRTIAQLLGRLPLSDRESSQKRFFDALVFNVSAACTEAHAKNFSILLRADRATLATLYDLGTHAPYPAIGALRSAMKVGNEYRTDAIGLRDFLTVATKLQIAEGYAEERVLHIRSNLASAFADAAAGIGGSSKDQAFANTVSNSISSLVHERGW